MLIYHTDNANRAISANLPQTYRKPTDNHPQTTPPPIGGVPWGSLPQGVMTARTVRNLVRDRWSVCTAFRMGIVAGEIGVRMVNPYRGRSAALFREGLRKGRTRHAALARGGE